VVAAIQAQAAIEVALFMVACFAGVEQQRIGVRDKPGRQLGCAEALEGVHAPLFSRWAYGASKTMRASSIATPTVK